MKKFLKSLLFVFVFLLISLTGLLFGTHSVDNCDICDKGGDASYANPIIRPISFAIFSSSNAIKTGKLTNNDLNTQVIAVSTYIDSLFFIMLTIIIFRLATFVKLKIKKQPTIKIFSKDSNFEKLFYLFSVFLVLLIIVNCLIFISYPKL